MGEKLNACNGCKVASYCSTACQRHDWKQKDHKVECKNIKAMVKRIHNELDGMDTVQNFSIFTMFHELSAKFSGRIEKLRENMYEQQEDDVAITLRSAGIDPNDEEAKQCMSFSQEAMMSQLQEQVDKLKFGKRRK